MPNKAELITAISDRAGLSNKDAGAALEALIQEVAGALRKGDRVAISGFGTFSVSNRAARQGRNPRTGDPIQIAASKNARFKAGKALKDSIQ